MLISGQSAGDMDKFFLCLFLSLPFSTIASIHFWLFLPHTYPRPLTFCSGFTHTSLKFIIGTEQVWTHFRPLLSSTGGEITASRYFVTLFVDYERRRRQIGGGGGGGSSSSCDSSRVVVAVVVVVAVIVGGGA